MWHEFTLAANLKLQSVSPMDVPAGDTFTNIRVLLFPPRLFCRRYVSFEFLYGTCLSPLAKAAMTSPSVERLLLIACVSFRRSPSACDVARRSDPARSTRLRRPSRRSPILSLRPVILRVKTLKLRKITNATARNNRYIWWRQLPGFLWP